MAITKRWQIAPSLSPDADAALHGYPPILRQILYNRGYASHEDARQFLEARMLPLKITSASLFMGITMPTASPPQLYLQATSKLWVLMLSAIFQIVSLRDTGSTTKR